MNQRLITLLINSFGEIFMKGITVTIPLTFISFTLALIIALLTAIVQIANIKGLKQIARLYVWIIRGTPLLVQLFVIFYGLPNLHITMNAFPAAILVFSLNTGAYASEAIRAAIEAVPVGQSEAGECVGMNYVQIMTRIVLPQALKTAFPPLSNSLIGLLKDTSLATNITITEMFLVSQRIPARTYETFALYCEVAVVYLLFCTVLTKLQSLCEKKLKIN